MLPRCLLDIIKYEHNMSGVEYVGNLSVIHISPRSCSFRSFFLPSVRPSVRTSQTVESFQHTALAPHCAKVRICYRIGAHQRSMLHYVEDV